MKNTFWAIALTALLFTAKSFGQDSIPSVEKSIKGIQIGDNGLVFNYEFKLSNKFTLRTETGYNVFIFTGDNNWTVGEKDKSSLAALPTFTVEPRWYYNLDRRVRKGKDIARNRANYVSLFVNYNGGWGAFKFDNRIDQAPDFVYIIPEYGLRRTLGQRFNYELGGGIGYKYVTKYNHFDHMHKSYSGVEVTIRARFGFDF
ncbi:hypothetical protein HYN59_12170 [Flavobacterium album]|uniref:DUF3575 domain-containing protein n=1 Tax=Flavobacterium album TaxID=2175091 RepID=A0A2S1QZH7_9FLAO|nr:hypothetical protein [Flavobacterium album]AWH85813.1 hypothetical protein HYN59_12170 [Flavobacterium album]